MNRFALPLVFVGCGVVLLAWRGGMLPGARESPHYPSDAFAIKNGQFWNLSAEEQVWVRSQYVSKLHLLLQEANNNLQRASYMGDWPAIHVQRNSVQQLMDSLDRAQNLSCDPTAERRVLCNITGMTAKSR